MGGLAQFLCAGGYEQFRRATRSHRSDLVVRLCGEVGLRPSEVVTVRSGDVHQIGGARFLAVEDREAFLPADVAHDLRKYARSVDGSESGGGPLVDVSKRRVQMLVRESGDRAADTTGDERFREVSTRDLRAAHARQLIRDGIDPRIVLAVTAYERLAALESHLDSPDREQVAAALSPESAADDHDSRLQRTVAAAADVGEALAAASTASDIHTTVCDRLADTEGYRFVWITEATGDGLDIRAHAGVETETVERILSEQNVTAALDDPEIRTENTETAMLVVIPLVDETTRGLLGVGITPDEIDETELDLLAALGAQVGHALTAVEHKRLLLADTVTELTFNVGREAAVIPETAAALDCGFELVGVVPADEGLLCYVAARDVTPDAVLEHTATTDAVGDIRLVGDDAAGILLELTLCHSPTRTLAEAGGRIQSYEVDSRGGRLVGDVSTDVDVRGVVETVTDAFHGVHLTAKRKAERETATDVGFRETLADELTERQAAALRSAYFGGYFEWPRDSTAEELADSLGVSSPTLHHHLRTAQQKLLRAFLDDT